MRFYLDEDLSQRVAEIARARDLDVISSHEKGWDGLSDEAQLRLAAEAERCIVTRNSRHFVPLTLRFMEIAWTHRGVLIVAGSLPNERYADIVAALAEYDRLHPDGMPSYSVDYLRTPSRA